MEVMNKIHFGRRMVSAVLAVMLLTSAICPSALAVELGGSEEDNPTVSVASEEQDQTADVEDPRQDTDTNAEKEAPMVSDEAMKTANAEVSAADDVDVGGNAASNDNSETGAASDEDSSERPVDPTSQEPAPGEDDNPEKESGSEINDNPAATEDDGATDILVEEREDTSGSNLEADTQTGAGTTTQTKGDAVTISRSADGETDIAKAISGLKSGDVFVDKSISAGKDNLGFDETLTVYASTQKGGTQYEVGNYIIVLDLTTSICRADLSGGLWNSLAKEASDMAKDICSGSDKNKVMIIAYSCDNKNRYTSDNPSAPVTVLLPMHNWNGVSGSLLKWHSSRASSQSDAQENGDWYVGISDGAASYAKSKGWNGGGSRKLGNGTWTQAALAYVGTYLDNWKGDKASTNVGVILITDGIPNAVQTSNLNATYNASSDIWKCSLDSDHSFEDDSDGNYEDLAKCTAYTIRTANYWKNKLNKEYNKVGFYAAQFDNGVYSNSSGLSSLGMWFVGVQTGYSKIATATSTGKTINYGWPAARDNNWYNSDHSTPSGSVAPNYVAKSVKVAKDRLGNVSASPFLGMYTKTAALSSAQISDALANVFADIEQLVKSESSCQPLQAKSFVTFHTATEQYMTVQGEPTIFYRGKSYSGTKSGDKYTFSIDGCSATVTVIGSGNASQVEAKIPAELVNKNAQADLEQKKTSPIQIKFTVGLFSKDYKTVYEKAKQDKSGAWDPDHSTLNTYTNNYTNSKTTATYTVDASNPSATYSKTDIVTARKGKNTTGTLDFVSQAKIGLAAKQTSVVLGNNGRLTLQFSCGDLEVTKTVVNPSEVQVGLDGFSFRLTGTSLLGEKVDVTATTDAKGKAVFSSIPVGNEYVLTEVSTKDGNGSIPDWWAVAREQFSPIGISTGATTTISASNVYKTGNVEVMKKIHYSGKKDAVNGNLKGFTFQLTGTSDSGAKITLTATTDETGKAVFNHVPVGTYQVNEIASPDRKEKMASWWDFITGEFEVNAKYQTTMTYTVHNRYEEGNLDVQKSISYKGKTDAVNSNLSGFVFRLSGTSASGVEVEETAVTDKTGKATFLNIPVGENYTVTEIASPDGKQSIADWWDAAGAKNVSVRSAYKQTLSFPVNNIYKEGDIEVQKEIRYDTLPDKVNSNLKGFRFHLTGTSASGATVDEYAVTDEKGVALFQHIPIGKAYTLTEVASPDSGDKIAEWWDALDAVATTVAANYKTKVTYQPVNYYESGNVVVRKHIELVDVKQYNTVSEGKIHYNTSLSGFAFHLYGTSMSGVAVDFYGVTNDKGEAIFNHIPIGTYTVEEIKASDVPGSAECKKNATQELIQYVIPKKQSVTVTYDKYANKENTVAIDFENVLKKWSFSGTGKGNNSLNKQDYEAEAPNVTQGYTSLEGAVYGLYDDGQLITQATTNREGRFDFDGWFVVGDKWYIQEISPSQGYLLDETRYPINACAKEYLTANQEHFQTETINAIYLTSKNQKSNTVTEQSIKQAIIIDKLRVNGTIATAQAGAKFGIYLESNLKAFAEKTSFKGPLNNADDWTEFFRAVRNAEVTVEGKSIGMKDIPTALLSENDKNKLDDLTASGKQKQYSVDWIVTGKDGKATSPELPYGKYVVYEAELPDNQVDPAQAMYAVISKDSRTPQVLGFSYLDFTANRYIQVVKRDGDTTKTVLKPGTQYLIYRCDENGRYSERDLLRQSYKNGNKTITVGGKSSPWTTDETGTITTVEELDAGTYAIQEVNAPEGYHNEHKDVVFTVSSNQIYDYRPVYDGEEVIGYDEYLVVDYTNPETRGELTIEKHGETVTGFEAPSILEGITNFLGLTDQREFTYEDTLLDGATYAIKAAEVIGTADGQGSVWYKKGETVAIAVTGKTGNITYKDHCKACGDTEYTYQSHMVNESCPYAAVSNRENGKVSIVLPLGKYIVTEIHAPYGYVLDEQEQAAELVWHNQEESVSYAALSFANPRTHVPENPESGAGKGNLRLTKKDALDETPVSGAVFGLYNATPIYNRQGELILEANTLLTTVTTDDEGVATVSMDLPLMEEGYTRDSQRNSGDYFFKEHQAAEFYELDATLQPVHVEYENQFVPVVGVRAAMTNKLFGKPDLRIVKAVDKVEVQEVDCAAEKAQLTYTMTVTNQGDGLAKGVIISDTLPENTAFISASEDGAYGADTNACVWKLERLTPGGSAGVTMTVLVDKSAKAGDVVKNIAFVYALNNLNGNETHAEPIPSNEVETKVIAPVMSIAKRQALNGGKPATNKIRAEAGDTITYFVDIANAKEATSDAFDVIISDTVPEGMTYVEGSADQGGSYDAKTHTLCWNVGTLEIGGIRTVSFQAKVPTTALNCSFVNVATVTASNAAELHASVPEETPAPKYTEEKDHASILIHYVDENGNPLREDYSVEGDINTEYDMTAMVFPAIEKEGTAYRIVGTGSYGKYVTEHGITKDSSPVVGKLDTDKELWIVYQTGSGSLENPMPSNEVVSEVGAPKLEIHKSVDVTEVQQVAVSASKDTVKYTFTVTNTGNSRACNVIVTDQLDERLKLESASVKYGKSKEGYRFLLGDLAVKEKATFEVETSISRKVLAPTEIENVAMVNADNNPDKPVSSETVITKVVAPMLTIVKTQALNDGKATTEKLTGKASDTVTYTITVTNDKDASGVAHDVKIYDLIPEGLTYVEGSAEPEAQVDGRKLTWSVGNLAVGESVSTSFRAAIPAEAKDENYKNIATVSAENAPGAEPKKPAPSNEVESNVPSNPKTGDSFDSAPWLLLCGGSLVCAGAVICIWIFRRRR